MKNKHLAMGVYLYALLYLLFMYRMYLWTVDPHFILILIIYFFLPIELPVFTLAKLFWGTRGTYIFDYFLGSVGPLIDICIFTVISASLMLFAIIKVRDEIKSSRSKNACRESLFSDDNGSSKPMDQKSRTSGRVYTRMKAWKNRLILVLAVIVMMGVFLSHPERQQGHSISMLDTISWLWKCSTNVGQNRNGPADENNLTLEQIRYAARKCLSEGGRIVQMTPFYTPEKTLRCYYVTFARHDEIRPEDFLPVIEDKEAFLHRAAGAKSPGEFYQALTASDIINYDALVFDDNYHNRCIPASRKKYPSSSGYTGLSHICRIKAHATRQLHQMEPGAVIVKEYYMNNFYEFETDDGQKYCYANNGLQKTENGCEIKSGRIKRRGKSAKELKEYQEKVNRKWNECLSGYKGE
jgi:hypothetical protein